MDIKATLAALQLALTALSSTIGTLANLEPAEYIVLPPEPPAVVSVKIFTAEVTAYTNAVEETDSTPDIMASGEKVFEGAIACPRKYPFGTKVEIEGEIYDCQDRMAEYLDHRFDIFMFSKSKAIAFGVQEKEIKILKNE